MTNQDTTQLRRDLQETVGKEICSVKRVFYTVGEAVERNEGPLELGFDDGSVALFKSGSNGQDLDLLLESWRDPFGGDLSPENRTYVDQYGKWSIFDVSSDEPYVLVCGHIILEVEEIALKEQLIQAGYPVNEAIADGWDVEFDTIVGAILSVGKRSIHVESKMDELQVEVMFNDQK